jgi:hypothetical protein
MLIQTEQNGDNMVAMATMAPPFMYAADESESVVGQARHERVVRLARLAMLIECEGCITIGMSPPTKTRNRPALYPTVDITNTATGIIDEAKETLIDECVGFTSREQRNPSGLGKKRRYDINIHAFDRVEKILTAVLPYLRSKKPQAEIVLAFIESRRNAQPKAAYSDREWWMVTEVRKMNACQPHRKALAKAKAYLDSPECDSRTRTTEYYRKYVEMCTTLQDTLDMRGTN